jgi:hypothetical protein
MSLGFRERAVEGANMWALLLGATLSACSAQDGGAGAAPRGSAEALLIDDLEDGDGSADTVLGQPSTWWVASDGSGAIAPPAGAIPLPQAIPGGRAASKRAMRVTGAGFTVWGADVSLGMTDDGPQGPFMDAAEFSGIRFWARAGEMNQSAVRFQIQDRQTQPAGGLCDPTPDSEQRCYNGFGASLESLDTEWRLYELSFSGLTQREGWGYRGDTVDATGIRNVEWTFEPGLDFDLWIDDVFFYR